MYIEILCPTCDRIIEISEELESLDSKDHKEIIRDLLMQNPYSFEEKPMIPETIEDELKIKAIKKLYDNLNLEQIENLVKQFTTVKKS